MIKYSKVKLILAFLASILNISLAAHFDEWRKRTIYQVLTDRFYPGPDYVPKGDTPESACDKLRSYCGGTYKGLIYKLDYIQELGFDAIWITPPLQNTELFDGTTGYHGYWMTSLDKVNEHFGSAQDLKDFVAECHKRDIYVMVDVVGNHAGPIMTNYSAFDGPLNKHEHYHEFCNIDLDHDLFQNQWRVERCWFAGSLADFKQEDPFVYKTLVDWIKRLVDTYSFDGIRIDTIPHSPRDFWKDFNKNADVFQLGEVYSPAADYNASYQKECLEGNLFSVLFLF